MEKDSIIAFLKQYTNKKIIYIPNPGNAGDSLIALGTINLFDSININYEIGDKNKLYENKLLFFGGGGNLVGLGYDQCKNFILNNQAKNKIVLLPHTINNEDKLIQNLSENVILICRELYSYNYVQKIIKNKNNVFISKDLAFYIDVQYLNTFHKKSKGVCNCFRLDREKTGLKIPNNNNDISQTLRQGISNNTSNLNAMHETCKKVFNYLADYEEINTNRLHVAIAGILLNKKVNLYPNSYWKNKAVYEYSIKEKYPNVKFIE
jgi:exopolysaccharide biosynthesis predicted pyruvyltransferase EpsI